LFVSACSSTDRALDCGSKGCGFDPRQAHIKFKDCSRRGRIVVECGGFENRCSSNATEGSNPSLSASQGLGTGSARALLAFVVQRIEWGIPDPLMWVQFPPKALIESKHYMKFEFSAGGVVFKKVHGETLILLGQHSQHHGWVFPKGLIGDTIKGEEKEATAVREVEEETGVLARIIFPLTPVTYWYQFQDQKIKKTVYYFIMEFVSEDQAKKDLEMENVEWVQVDKVEEKLTYKSDKQVWKEALKMVQSTMQ
jgi:8-oxo-dGTP pyrophosphatase MutT (NUDIX family)